MNELALSIKHKLTSKQTRWPAFSLASPVLCHVWHQGLQLFMHRALLDTCHHLNTSVKS